MRMFFPPLSLSFRRSVIPASITMKWLRKHWRAVVSVLVAAFLVSRVIGESEAIQQCIREEASDHRLHESDKSSHVFGYVIASRYCVGEFVHANGEALIAFFTLGLVGVTGVLAFYTYGLFAATKELATEAEKSSTRQFLATFRPRLKLRAIRLNQGTDSDGMPIGVLDYSLVNIGASGARIVGGNVGADLFVKNTPFPAIPNLKTEFNTLYSSKPDILFAGGEMQLLTLPLNTTFHPSLIDIFTEHNDLMVVGSIKYVDDNDVARYYGFLRRFEPKTGRFIRVDDPDYDYAD